MARELLIRGRLGRVFAMSLVACALVAAPGTAAMAAGESEAPNAPAVELRMDAGDGNSVPVELPEAAPEQDESVATPYLLNPVQWANCQAGNSSYKLRYFHYRGMDDWYKAYLTCGTAKTGYIHIKNEHQAQWQKVWNNAVAKGWKPKDYSMKSWDDLMWMSLNGAMSSFDMRYSTVTNKVCGNVKFDLVSTKTGKIVYSFRTEGVASMNNKIAITSYPSSRTTCSTN